MNDQQYNYFLKECPPSNSPLFINFVRASNKVVDENDHWILIKNIKYHTKQSPWLTVFIKSIKQRFSEVSDLEFLHLQKLIVDNKLVDYFKFENDLQNKTVKRFHLHFVKKRHTATKIFLK